MQLETYLDNLIAQYEGYFDIQRPHVFAGSEILAYARFTRRTTKYMLTKQAQLYATEVFEHVFFVYASNLDEAAFAREKERIIAAEQEYVQPNADHMYSYITLILLCGHIEEPVKQQVRRMRYTKNYRYGIQGYSTVRIAAVDLGDQTFVLNRQAKELKAVLTRAFGQ